MLSLTEQIRSAQLCIDGVVRYDESLGGSGEQIDPDLAEQLPLGFRNIGVTRPTSMSTGAMVSVPRAIAPTACMPPRQ